MKIRHPNDGDRAALIALSRQLHTESWYKQFDFSEDKANAIITQCIESPEWLGLIAQGEDGVICGFLAGAIAEHFFGYDRYACDLCIYVEPGRRGGPAATRLIANYEAWCRIKGVKEIHIGTSAGINSEGVAAFYERLGYHSRFMGFRKIVR